MKNLFRATWDRLTLYLPILLMGLFALGTWWLVRSTPSALETASDKPVKHEADYFLRKFSIKTFDGSGRLKSEVFGGEAQHYPDTDTLEIESVRMRSFTAEGRLTVATANRAISNGDGSDVQLLGDAHVVREPAPGLTGSANQPIEYRGEFLHAFTKSETLTTHLPVVISRGADRFSGNTMAYDNIGAIVELQGQVRGFLAPRRSQ